MSAPLTIEEVNNRISSFTKLTAIGIPDIKSKPRKLIFKCECGTTKTLQVKEVLRGKCKSCGCLLHTLTIAEINEKLKDTRLTALSFADPGLTKRGWEIRKCLCRCICGKTKSIKLGSLTTGVTKSCGCLDIDTKTKYNENNKILYNTFNRMISRCYNPKDYSYIDYGAKGVTVCEEWKSSYQNFLTWSLSNGWKPGLQIDKDIKANGKKIYSPDTCLWVTQQVNMMYQSKAFKIEYKGEMINLRVYCHNIGMDSKQYRRVYNRIKKKGWSLEKAITKDFPDHIF